MKDKDITEKHLEDYNDVFSDIVNVLLFNGKNIVGEDELENTKDMSQYKANNMMHEQERDITKFWKKDKKYIPTKDTIEHVDEVLKLMTAITGDNRYIEVQQKNEGGVKNMCEVIDAYINTGIMRGKIKVYADFVKEGIITVEEAAKRANMTVEEFEKVVEEIEKKR